MHLVTMGMQLPRFWKSSIGTTILCCVACCSSQNTDCNTLSDVRLLLRSIVERASQEEVTVDYANDLDTKRYESACWTV